MRSFSSICILFSILLIGIALEQINAGNPNSRDASPKKAHGTEEEANISSDTTKHTHHHTHQEHSGHTHEADAKAKHSHDHDHTHQQEHGHNHSEKDAGHTHAHVHAHNHEHQHTDAHNSAAPQAAEQQANADEAAKPVEKQTGEAPPVPSEEEESKGTAEAKASEASEAKASEAAPSTEAKTPEAASDAKTPEVAKPKPPPADYDVERVARRAAEKVYGHIPQIWERQQKIWAEQEAAAKKQEAAKAPKKPPVDYDVERVARKAAAKVYRGIPEIWEKQKHILENFDDWKTETKAESVTAKEAPAVEADVKKSELDSNAISESVEEQMEEQPKESAEPGSKLPNIPENYFRDGIFGAPPATGSESAANDDNSGMDTSKLDESPIKQEGAHNSSEGIKAH